MQWDPFFCLVFSKGKIIYEPYWYKFAFFKKKKIHQIELQILVNKVCPLHFARIQNHISIPVLQFLHGRTQGPTTLYSPSFVSFKKKNK